MIHIQYTRCGDNGFCITAVGHAGAGPPGQDIVCAGVSVLMDTLADSLMSAADRGLSEVEILRESGNYRFEGVLPPPEDPERRTVAAMLSTVLRGLRMMAQSYPDRVAIAYETKPDGL